MLKPKNQTAMQKNEHGNVLFMVLIAVVYLVRFLTPPHNLPALVETV